MFRALSWYGYMALRVLEQILVWWMDGVYGIGYFLDYKSTCSAMRKDGKLINIASNFGSHSQTHLDCGEQERWSKTLGQIFLRFIILYLSTVDINFDTKAMYYVLCSMYYVQYTMYMMVQRCQLCCPASSTSTESRNNRAGMFFSSIKPKEYNEMQNVEIMREKNIFWFCDSRQCVEIILRDNHYLHRHHHHNYHHHIDNNVFFIIIIRDVRRFTAMCWLSPTLSLASHLPDCLGISYFVFQIVFTLFLSVLKFHIILYCLFFCKALSVFLHRRLDELPCRRLLAFHPLHRKVFYSYFFSTTGKTCLLLRNRKEANGLVGSIESPMA